MTKQKKLPSWSTGPVTVVQIFYLDFEKMIKKFSQFKNGKLTQFRFFDEKFRFSIQAILFSFLIYF